MQLGMRDSAPASVALDTRALDPTGTIVGSSSETLPNIPANSHFDFFGHLGGGIGPELTGTPAKIEVSPAENAFGQKSMASRISGQVMQCPPPRPRPSSAPTIVMTSTPALRSIEFVCSLRSYA